MALGVGPRRGFGVPGDWGWGTTGNAKCLEDLTDRTVGRPGVGDLLSCEDTNAKNVTFLWFSGATFGNGDPVPLREGGDREVWIIGDVALQLQARKPLQERILGTVHRIDTDYAGCPVTDPISMDPARRPPDPVDVAQLSGVTTVSACQYELAESRRVVEQNEAALVGSVLLTGADAAAAIRRVVAAPVRRGWNRATCSVDYGSNTSGVVLRIAATRASTWSTCTTTAPCADRMASTMECGFGHLRQGPSNRSSAMPTR